MELSLEQKIKLAYEHLERLKDGKMPTEKGIELIGMINEMECFKRIADSDNYK